MRLRGRGARAALFSIAALVALGSTGAVSAGASAVGGPSRATGAVPGPAGLVTAVAGNASAQLTWAIPFDYGSPLTGYRITPYIADKPQVPIDIPATVPPVTVTSLQNGTAYSFTVAGRNANGLGPASGPSNTVVPTAPLTAPAAPTIGTATPGDKVATVTWTTPSSDGGAPISGYRVTTYVLGLVHAQQTFTSTATSQKITGLTDGTTYQFSVAAINSVGVGDESQRSVPVIPQAPGAVPGTPGIPVAMPGNGQATLQWTAPPTDGGRTITGYTVVALVAGVPATSTTFSSPGLTETLPGLTNGVAYTFTVAAINQVGTGPASGPSLVVVPPFSLLAAFVSRQYVDLTGAGPSSTQLAAGLQSLQSGGSPGAFVASLRHGADATANVDPVTRLYFAYFLRIPDAGGLQHWITSKRTGTSLGTISSAFASSSEFVKRYGQLTNLAFVNLVYENVLGRPADSGGLTFWTKQLDTHAANRGGVMIGFSESQEYRSKKAPSVDVAATWISLLGAAPSQATFDSWVASLRSSDATLGSLAAAVLAMPAYSTRVGA